MKTTRTLVSGRLTRRLFLERAARGMGVAGLGGALAFQNRGVAGAAKGGGSNPFIYSVGRFGKTDPKLIRYREISRFRSPRPKPRRIVFGPDGHLYLAAGRYVTALDAAEGRTIREIALTGPALCLAVVAGGTMYVGLRDHVEVFDRRGKRTASWPSPGGKAWLTGLAVGASCVFVADAGNRILQQYDLAGNLVAQLGKRDRDRNIPGFVIPSPYFDVEMHRDGLLRVNNPGRHRVEAYTVKGEFELAWGRASAAIDGFSGCCNPISLALLEDGRFVTCEKGLPRVKVYSDHGEFESVVAGPESFPENARVGAGDGMSDGLRASLDAAADSQGRIYILDTVTGSIRVMAEKDAPAA